MTLHSCLLRAHHTRFVGSLKVYSVLRHRYYCHTSLHRSSSRVFSNCVLRAMGKVLTHFGYFRDTIKKRPFITSLPLFLLFTLVAFTLALPTAVPLRAPSNGVLVLPEAEQQCAQASCLNLFDTGGAFCRSLNRGCYLCGPNPSSLLSLSLTSVIGRWSGHWRCFGEPRIGVQIGLRLSMSLILRRMRIDERAAMSMDLIKLEKFTCGNWVTIQTFNLSLNLPVDSNTIWL